MKHILTVMLAMLMAMLTVANPRTMEEAMQIAGRFAADKQPAVSSVQRIQRALSAGRTVQPMQWAYTQTQTDNATPALYVFNTAATDGGFVIVAADDRARAILGYADNGAFDAENIPDNLRFWLRMYASEIAALSGEASAGGAPTAATDAAAATNTTYPIVDPLLGETVWGQGTPFNNQCPTKDNERCVTGCVATAASQIMYYHKYPKTGTGSHSYEWNSQTLKATFGKTTYDWTNMLPDYSGTYTNAQATAVATLMYHVGVACEMQYDLSANGGSGAYSSQMMQALIDYFGYDAGIRVLPKDYMNESEMLGIIAQDLQAGHPIFMSGSTTKNEGHAFVLDGMLPSGYVHINWGWNGYYNAYFPISAMDPTGQGTGGAASGEGFTERVTAYTGIQPNQSGNAIPLIIADNITLTSKARLRKSDNVSFSIYPFQNSGIANAAGEVVYIIYKDNALYTTQSTGSSYDLPSGYYYTNAYNVGSSLSSLAAGDYELSVGVLPTGGTTPYPILTETPRGEHRFPLTVTADSVFMGTAGEKQYTIRLAKASGCDMDITGGLWLWWWAEDNTGECVSATLDTDGWYTATVTSTANSVNCLAVNRDVTDGSWSGAQQTEDYTGITEDVCLKIGGKGLTNYNIYAADCSTSPISPTPNRNFEEGTIVDYGKGNKYLHLYSSANPTDNTVAAHLYLDLYSEYSSSIIGSYVWAANSDGAIGTMSALTSFLFYTVDGVDVTESFTDGATTIWLDADGNYRIAYTTVTNDTRYTDTVSIEASKMYISGTPLSNTGVTALTVAEALDKTNALSSGEYSSIPYFVRGEISSVREISTSYGNATFYIKDKDADNNLYVYRVYGLNNTKFSTGKELATGDDVIVLSLLQNYKGTTPELSRGYVYKKEVAANYIPTNLQAVVTNNITVTFCWEVAEGDLFELKYTRLNSDREDSISVSDTSATMNNFTAGTYQWWVRTRTLSGKYLSDWIQGNDFVIQETPYTPYNLTATSTDGYHYTFSWQADQAAPSYTLVITYEDADSYYHSSTAAAARRDVTLALNGDYSWCVIANSEDDTPVAQTCADDTISVTSAPASVVSGLQINKSGLTATITWEGDAPYYQVRIYDNNYNWLEGDVLDTKSYIYTASENGTYWVWVRPVNEEQTYYIGSAVQESFAFFDADPVYTPYNLQASAGYGKLSLSWQVQQGSNFRINISVDNGDSYVFTSDKTSLNLNVAGLESRTIFWKVCTLNDAGGMLSEFVQGPDVLIPANPYEPKDLQATSKDGYTYTFTWTAETASPLYYIIIENASTGNTVHTHVVSQMSETYTFTQAGSYNWTVYACAADSTFQGFQTGAVITVNTTPDFSLSNLSVTAQGLVATATWESLAPCYEVTLYDAGNAVLYTDTVETHLWQRTVPVAGTYRIAVTPLDTHGNALAAAATDDFTATEASGKYYTLTLSATPTEGGTVTATPQQNAYEEGTAVTVTASPNTGYRFTQWSDGITQAMRTLIMNDNYTLVATFVQDIHTDAVTNLRVSPYANLKARATWSSDAPQFHIIVTNAAGEEQKNEFVTAKQYIFSGTKTGQYTLSVQPVTDDATTILGEPVTKNFSLVHFYDLYISAGTGGTVNEEVNMSYPAGTQVEIIATPNRGYVFNKWSDGDKKATRTLVMDQDYADLKATFTKTYTLSISAGKGGQVNEEVNGTYRSGDQVEIIATPDRGYNFDRWSDGNRKATRTLDMYEDYELTALFRIITYSVTIEQAENGKTSLEAGTYSYDYGDELILTPIADKDYLFDYWMVNEQPMTDYPLALVIDKDYSIRPYFKPDITAVDNITDGFVIRTDGYTIEIVAATELPQIALMDALGKQVGVVHHTDHAVFTVPQAGIYVIRTTNRTAKVLIP